MSVKKIKEFRSLSENELKKRLGELRKELIKLNAQVATGTVPKSPGLIKDTKKGIAMILTLLREKELDKDKETKEVSKTNE
jgi:large subunit ribosomal protein L29